MDLRELPEDPDLAGFVRHPWERARAGHFARVLKTVVGHEPMRVLDVGAGDAFMASTLLRTLPPGSTVDCVDPEYAQRTPPDLHPGVRLHTERPREKYDVVLLCDLLEHIDDDVAFLRAVAEENVSDGHLLVTVPAHPMLLGAYDRFLGHFRRYRPREGHALVRAAGLTIEQSGGLFGALLPLRLASWARERALGAPDDMPTLGNWRRSRAFTEAVIGALAVDSAIARGLSRRGIDGPGLSWWALCRRARR